MQDRPTRDGYGIICRRELDRILDGERTRSENIARLQDKARECHETAGSEPGASHYLRQAQRLTKSKVAFATVLTVWAFVSVECSGRPGECYPLSCRAIVERSRSKGGAVPMLPMRQVQRAALELERLGMLERWTFEGVEMWGMRFPELGQKIRPKRHRRRTPPKKQDGASAARDGASAARTSLSKTETSTTQSARGESDTTTTTAPLDPSSLESWLAAGRRDGVNLEEVEAMWRDLNGPAEE